MTEIIARAQAYSEAYERYPITREQMLVQIQLDATAEVVEGEYLAPNEGMKIKRCACPNCRCEILEPSLRCLNCTPLVCNGDDLDMCPWHDCSLEPEVE